MKNTLDFYNKTAHEWAKEWYQNESMLPILKLFFKYLPPHPTVLDLCCGAGYESKRMVALGAKVIGLDFSEESLNIAKANNPNLSFYNDNILNDYSYIGRVDAIVCIAGLVHIENKDLELTFERMHSVLKNNGYVLLVVREGKGKLKKQSFVSIDNEEYDRNFIAHTLDELREYSKGFLQYLCELDSKEEDIWKKYIFIKETK